MGSPLFRNSDDLLRKAQTAFKRSAAGTVIREVESVSKGKRSTSVKLSRALSQMKRLQGQPHRLIREAVGTELGEIVGEMARYARNPAGSREIVQFLGALGPVGKVIQAIVGPLTSGKVGTTPSIKAAINLVRAAGAEVLPPLDVKSGPDFDRALEAVQAWATTHGYPVTPARAPVTAEPFLARPGVTGRQPPERKTVDVPLSTGGTKRFPKDHPIVTGEFVMCPASTNVHSFGYDLQSAILYVRYLHHDESGNRTGPGSLYRYSPVEPELFESLYKVRRGGGGSGGQSTPGTWVWSNLRVRGTVSVHQKGYALVGVMNRYVPRKATVHPDFGEIFVQRKVRTVEGKRLTSRLPHGEVAGSRLSRAIQSGNGAPRTGRPNGPNRGRPRTGRP